MSMVVAVAVAEASLMLSQLLGAFFLLRLSRGMGVNESCSRQSRERSSRKMSNAKKNPDALRVGPVRLLGYANEVGESFKPLVPKSVYLASYGVAGAYVMSDASWRSKVPPPGRSAIVEAVDTFVWQGLASVAIPGFVINRIVSAAGQVSPASIVRWSPTAAGLVSIPFIIKPIDHGVDLLMDSVMRPFYSSAKRE